MPKQQMGLIWWGTLLKTLRIEGSVPRVSGWYNRFRDTKSFNTKPLFAFLSSKLLLMKRETQHFFLYALEL